MPSIHQPESVAQPRGTRADFVSRLSPPLLQLLHETAGQSVGESRERLADVIRVLSERFTKGLDAPLSAYLDDPALASAYQSYYLPVNAAKVAALLAELPKMPAERETPQWPLRVLELGGGPGTGLVALLDWYAQQSWRDRIALEIITVDRSARALEQGARLSAQVIKRLNLGRATVTSIHTDLERLPGAPGISQAIPPGPYDLILLVNCLNELYRSSHDSHEARVAFMRHWLKALSESGTFMVIEPALRPVARQLHRVRDALLQAGDCTVYSPCLHEAPCPALIKEDDWCHEERPWASPDWIVDLDRELGFIKDALKFSYLLLRKDGQTIVPREPNVFRVVSELRPMKGDTRAWLCNETGRPEVGRLDRERSDTNVAVEAWHRGAIVRISEIIRKERKGREGTVGRIPASAKVEIIRSS